MECASGRQRSRTSKRAWDRDSGIERRDLGVRGTEEPSDVREDRMRKMSWLTNQNWTWLLALKVFIKEWRRKKKAGGRLHSWKSIWFSHVISREYSQFFRISLEGRRGNSSMQWITKANQAAYSTSWLLSSVLSYRERVCIINASIPVSEAWENNGWSWNTWHPTSSQIQLVFF